MRREKASGSNGHLSKSTEIPLLGRWPGSFSSLMAGSVFSQDNSLRADASLKWMSHNQSLSQAPTFHKEASCQGFWRSFCWLVWPEMTWPLPAPHGFSRLLFPPLSILAPYTAVCSQTHLPCMIGAFLKSWHLAKWRNISHEGGRDVAKSKLSSVTHIKRYKPGKNGNTAYTSQMTMKRINAAQKIDLKKDLKGI